MNGSTLDKDASGVFPGSQILSDQDKPFLGAQAGKSNFASRCFHVLPVTNTRFWYAAWSCFAPEGPVSYEVSWAHSHRMNGLHFDHKQSVPL